LGLIVLYNHPKLSTVILVCIYIITIIILSTLLYLVGVSGTYVFIGRRIVICFCSVIDVSVLVLHCFPLFNNVVTATVYCLTHADISVCGDGGGEIREDVYRVWGLEWNALNAAINLVKIPVAYGREICSREQVVPVNCRTCDAIVFVLLQHYTYVRIIYI